MSALKSSPNITATPALAARGPRPSPGRAERGSVIALSNASGTAIATNTYDEYGIPASTNVGRFGYTGQAWIAELGMQYSKARIYSPTLGRFMQTDPIGYADGPNLYNYVGSDPVNRVDPWGLAGCDADICVTAKKPRRSGGGGGVGFSGTTFLGGGSRGGSPAPGIRIPEPSPERIAAKEQAAKEKDADEKGESGKAQKTQTPTPCQRAFLAGQLSQRGLPTSHLGSVKFVSGLDQNANAFTRSAFKGAKAVTQGSTVYVQPRSFDEVANFRSPVGFEEVYHTSQFASDGGSFYSRYALLSVGGVLSGNGSYKGNMYEAFAKGASNRMNAAYSGVCPK